VYDGERPMLKVKWSEYATSLSGPKIFCVIKSRISPCTIRGATLNVFRQQRAGLMQLILIKLYNIAATALGSMIK
jgi:hypothetical protein